MNSPKKHYITPGGFKLLQDEFKQLKYVERPEVTATVAWAASNGDRSENADYQYGKRRLRQIDSRIHFLLKRIDSAEVIDPATIKYEYVTFGATVTILDDSDQEKKYSLVGIDNSDVARGHISYISPLGSALLKAKVGDYVTFTSPKGEQGVEIIAIEYIAID